MQPYHNLITPCIKYLSDKKLTDAEYEKLFVLHQAVFGLDAKQEDHFISYCYSEGLCPRKYLSDEIGEMQKKLIKPQGKRVHPIGCFDITRINAFGAVSVPKTLCTECRYSKTYCNMRKDNEDTLLAYILHTGNIPPEARLSLSSKSPKQYEEIMRSSLAVQCEPSNEPCVIQVKLNAFILRYLTANSALLNFENIEDTLNSIKIKIDTVLIKELKLSAAADKVMERLHNELLNINRIDTSAITENTLTEIWSTLCSEYSYPYEEAIHSALKEINDTDKAKNELNEIYEETKPQIPCISLDSYFGFDNTQNTVIPDTAINTSTNDKPVTDKSVNIIEKSARQTGKAHTDKNNSKNHNKEITDNKEKKTCIKQNESHAQQPAPPTAPLLSPAIHDSIPKKSDNAKGTQHIHYDDPASYYPENYSLDADALSQIKIAGASDILLPYCTKEQIYEAYPYVSDINASCHIAAETAAIKGQKGILICIHGKHLWFFSLSSPAAVKSMKAIIRKNPLFISINAMEVYALLKSYGIYGGRIYDLKDIYRLSGISGRLPASFKALMSALLERELDCPDDFYPSAMKYYETIFTQSKAKLSLDGRLDELEQSTAVSMSMGYSSQCGEIFSGMTVPYKRKSLFQYETQCFDTICPKLAGTFYAYSAMAAPDICESFYNGLIRALAEKDAFTLGKTYILRLTRNCLILFSLETSNKTYELLQWPCVSLARKYELKDRRIYYKCTRIEKPNNIPIKISDLMPTA